MWHSENESSCGVGPQSGRFNPWPHSVGRGSGVAMSRGVGHRCGSDPKLIWYMLAAIAPIQPLVWGMSICRMFSPKKHKKKRKEKKKVLARSKYVKP